MLRRAVWTRGSRLLQRKTLTRRHIHHSPSMMARILCSDPIDSICPDLLRAAGHDVTCSSVGLSHAELVDQVSDCDVLIIRSDSNVDRQVLDAANQLKLIGRAGTGVDNIDMVNATKQGVLVINTPYGNTISAAELTVGLISSVSQIDHVDALKTVVRHSEIHGKTLGIVGLGRIGREVATRCNAFGMNVIGYDSILSDASAKTHGIEPVTLNELFSRSDYISLHVPLTANTKHLVNAKRLALCKEGVKLINGARAGLIDHVALLEAMESGKVAGAAFDSYPPSSDTWKQLVEHKKVLVTPHIGALTMEAQEKVARDMAYKVNDALAGKAFKGVLNAPNIDFSRREELPPLLSLAEKLGSMQAQLLDENRLKRVLVVAEGPKVTSSELSGHLVKCVLKGLLSQVLEEEVSLSNAKQLAEIMGIQTVEHKHDEASGSSFSDQLSVIFEKENGTVRKITGTVFGQNHLRFVSFDELPMDAIPSGSMLLFNNTDQPGVLHNVTSVLAKHQINIGCFGLAREKLGAAAVGVLNVDEAIPDAVIEELEALGLLTNLRRVNLLELDTTRPGGLWNEFVKPLSNAIEHDVDPAQKETEVAILRHPKPRLKPSSPNFGSGPCKKRPGYALSSLPDIALGRSHRSKLGKSLLEEAIVRSKKILKIPDTYRLGIVPASDTGAFEMAMWSMLGERPVDVCYWESFGKLWFRDVTMELELKNVRAFRASFGELPDLSHVNCDHDVVFTWNGTTSGVRVPNADWIASDRQGLIFNDATSAAFAMEMPWLKIDVCTFSWQKVLGGEGGHGVIVLSPRAVERLETFRPANRPLPKIFRMTDATTGKLLDGIFEGSTINTPSLLCVEDYLDALRWAESVGGLDGLIAISQRNLKVVEDFAAENARWFKFLAADKAIRSSTSVCLRIDGFSREEVKQMQGLLEREQVAYDIGSYADAPPGLRIWCGATVETKDVEALLPWIKWAYLEVKSARTSKN